MKPKTIIITVIIIIIAIIGACTQTPSQPQNDNPFDPKYTGGDNISPIISLKINPDSGIANETLFKFDALGSYENDLQNLELAYRWDIDNDGQFERDWSKETVYSGKINKGGGNKQIKLEVMGLKSLVSDTVFSVFVNTRPLAQFTAMPYPNNFQHFHFDASASSDYEDGSNLQYRWDWENDGVWDTGFLTEDTISHQYGSGGNYTINLQVRDSGALTATTSSSISMIDLVFVLVPAGPYTYGSSTQTLTINYNYQIMKYEVTNAQYATYLEDALAAGEITVTSSSVQGYYSGDSAWAAGNYEFYDLDDGDNRIHWNGSNFTIDSGYEDHPVVEAAWFGANGMAEHYGLRLPTEHEWEKAARGNSGWDYPWGNSIDGSRANYSNSGDPFDNGTTPAGYYDGSNHGGFQTTDSPSPYGAYDMAGNVREWCDSFWSGTSNSRVVRGGSWSDGTNVLRSWYRNIYNPNSSSFINGFRLSGTF